MAEKQNAGAADAGTPSSSADHGLDTSEDNAIAAARKRARAELEAFVRETLAALGGDDASLPIRSRPKPPRVVKVVWMPGGGA
jgi:hypothetical protein